MILAFSGGLMAVLDLLVGGPQAALAPSGLMALAVVTLTGMLIALLATSAQIAVAATASPLRSRSAAFREKSWCAAFLPQRDPDAPGRARPRAPTAAPAAA